MKTLTMRTSASCIIGLLLTIVDSKCKGQQSVSVSGVNGVSEGSTQIGSELWTIASTSAECPVGTRFPAHTVNGITVGMSTLCQICSIGTLWTTAGPMCSV